ncbi:hypothetical protein [Prevotella sp. S7-1-8]|uniref:hypothetical protein n=1 Tax=Prevotella sp. S7-1-8 TaxID=1284775 RepID=UPI0018CF89A9|nr:hypothetical protein [Prevotella sp. S7-1-8]
MLKKEQGREITCGHEPFRRLPPDEGLMLPPTWTTARVLPQPICTGKREKRVKDMDVQHVNRVWLSAVASVWTNDAARCPRFVPDSGKQ